MKFKLFATIMFITLFSGCVTYVSLVDTNPVGKTYLDSILITDIDIPLPKGNWEVMGRGYMRDNNYFEILLFNTENKDIIFIKRDTLTNTFRGYQPNKYLQRDDIHHSVVKNNNLLEAHDGWLINHYRLSIKPKKSQAAKESYDFIVKNNYALPGNYIQIFHHFTGDKKNPSKFLHYSHYVNPEAKGFDPPANANWKSSDWHPLKINNSPSKVEFIDELKKEGEIMHAKIKNAFDQ